MEEDSEASLGDNSLSGNERDSNDFNSSDTIDGSSDPGDYLDNNKPMGSVEATAQYSTPKPQPER